jgi:hypothetical protein
MHYNRKYFFSGLAVLNVGTFLITAILLPRTSGTIMYQSPIGGFIARRQDWHIAWCVLLGTLTVSIAFYLILEAFSQNKQSNEHCGPIDAAAHRD